MIDQCLTVSSTAGVLLVKPEGFVETSSTLDIANEDDVGLTKFSVFWYAQVIFGDQPRPGRRRGGIELYDVQILSATARE